MRCRALEAGFVRSMPESYRLVCLISRSPANFLLLRDFQGVPALPSLVSKVSSPPLRRYGHPIRTGRRPTSPRDVSGQLNSSSPRGSVGDWARMETGRRRIGNRGQIRPLPPAGVARPGRFAPLRDRRSAVPPRGHTGHARPGRSRRTVGFTPSSEAPPGRDPTGVTRPTPGRQDWGRARGG